MGILREYEILSHVAHALLEMCSRCRGFVREKKSLGGLVLKEKQKGCQCGKQCDRLIEGICADCSHYVEHS